MVLRIFATIVLLLSILFMPFWITAILAILSMVYFSYFLEIVFLLFLSDILFGIHMGGFAGVTFMSFLISVLVFFTIEFIKKRIWLNK